MVATASVDYSLYEGNSVCTGTGGTRKTVKGVDIWDNGTPPTTYKILGIMVDKRGDDIFSDARFFPALAEECKKEGGDAVVILGSNASSEGAIYSYGAFIPIVVKATKAEVIRYLDKRPPPVPASTPPPASSPSGGGKSTVKSKSN